MQSYNIASHYLKSLKFNVFEKLYQHGYYPNTLNNSLRTEFLDWLVEETEKELEIKSNIR